MQSRVSLVMGPTVWNDLPLELHLLPITRSDPFYNHLKTVLLTSQHLIRKYFIVFLYFMDV